jgi:methylphosphotriester-DNA--protein-cysteine methyltransferase
VHKRLLTLIAGTAILLLSNAPAPHADTLAEETTVDSAAATANAFAAIAPDSPRTVAAHRDTTADTMSHRDSTLRNVLAKLAKEDSLNALAAPAVVPTPAPPSPLPKKTGPLRLFEGLLTWIKRLPPWTLPAAGTGMLLFALSFIAVRTTGSRAEKRFLTTTRLSLMDGEVQHACLHIEKSYADPALTPARVCADLITGEAFLEALFSRDLGMGITGYIDQVRIHRAKQFARANPGADIQTVAMQVGFVEVNRFEEQFKKLTGKTFEEFPKA